MLMIGLHGIVGGLDSVGQQPLSTPDSVGQRARWLVLRILCIIRAIERNSCISVK